MFLPEDSHFILLFLMFDANFEEREVGRAPSTSPESHLVLPIPFIDESNVSIERDLEAEYDSMADEYDATRESATQAEVAALADALEGCKSVLDLGIGTGRFAKPLSDLGFDVTGVDVSRRMIMKAREKGLDRLVVGDAYALPFSDKSFDAAITIHVLHVVVDWIAVVRDLGRVTRGPVMLILRVPQGPQDSGVAPAPFGSSSITQDSRREHPTRTQHRMWQNELELKTRIPPRKLERIRDETISISVAEAIKRANAKRSLGAQIIPPEVKQQMLERILAMAGDQIVQRRIVEDLAVWDAGALQSLGN
jgi:ubiquinone/menaquinone biosynthesis C-methylase UbiE